ncbi:hypothetical protein GJ744_001810 [Endocarpon pusillum]|uniref:Uncharacterized protein n=1 Tax=Endocarpon pusillum TaxID=364733 RepID=A0A8H7ACR2_9EURO|nr:hypothetical protein GJ744_001810 [Endocarpon pusillum]
MILYIHWISLHYSDERDIYLLEPLYGLDNHQSLALASLSWLVVSSKRRPHQPVKFIFHWCEKSLQDASMALKPPEVTKAERA